MNNRKVILWSIVVALGGFLFGFDTAVISGAEQSIQKYWDLTTIEHGLTLSIVLLGTIIGCLPGSISADKLGRRRTLIIIAAIYLIASLGTAIASNWYIFLAFRFLGGLGVGASSVIAPVYISEIAPAEKRGRLVALFQFNIVFGILFSYFSNYLIGQEGDAAWRWMLGVQAIPSFLFLVLLQLVPESPSWLILKKGKTEEAKATLRIINPDNYKEVMETIKSGGAGQLISRTYRFPVFLAVAFAAWCCIRSLGH
jgi:MFS family permease